MKRFLFLVFATTLVGGCAEPPPPETVPDEPAADEPRPTRFDARLLEIARDYESYGRLDTAMRWAPAPCAAPASQTESTERTGTRPRFSASKDARTHGRKLYYLFVKEMPAVLGVNGDYVRPEVANPVGQVVVKEAWEPEEVKDTKDAEKPVARIVKVRRGEALVEQEDRFVPVARRDGRLYRAARKASLFVMFKLPPDGPGTDQGWVYGTVSADGKRVTSAGRVESCMACHREAPHDRLFGLASR